MGLHESIYRLISEDEACAIRTMYASFGINIMNAFQFWEALVARILSGRMTDHQCAWDVEIDYCGKMVRVEVKHSAEFACRFSTGSRPVFKFAYPKGQRTPKRVDAIVLIGIDAESDVHAWVLPAAAIGMQKSITLTSPKYLTGTSSRTFPMDRFRCPPTQILPEVLRASSYHLAHAPRKGARYMRALRRIDPRQLELFGQPA